MTGTQRYSILITDDDRGVREVLGEIVETRGFRPVLASHGEEAVEIVQHEPIHLALLDMQMPRLTGLETLQLVRQVNALLPAILITADATLELMRRAFDAQVFSVVPKPVNPHVVIATVVRALGRIYGTVDEPPPKPEFGEPTK
jgi:two-component system, response regulator PdtaR